jgi:hypothetical protein
MSMPLRATALVLASALAACAPNDRQPPTSHVDGGTPLPRQAGVTVKDGLTTGKVVFHGIPVLAPEAPATGRQGHRLRSEVVKADGATRHWLDMRIHWVGSGIDAWVSAHEIVDGAAPIPLRLGIGELDIGTCAAFMWVGCDHDEEISAEIPEGKLMTAAEHGMVVRFAMKGGRTYTARLTPDQARAQLVRLAAWRRDGR